jgi:phosphomannomutase
MVDGGASPKEFTDRVEAQMDADAAAAENTEEAAQTPSAKNGSVKVMDLMPPYLAALKELVDGDAIAAAGLKVVVDPLFGAGRGYLAQVLTDLGVEVVEINNACDPTFDGLHPEPIPPWVDRGLAKVKELGYDALFINDGDADRIGAGDSRGNFVNPHRIITLVTQHMVARGETGRVVSTITASALLDRACRKLGLELISTPVGFKWIYGEMERGGVMIGGEESGGIGLPGHVKERDGLLMALLLTEMMAQTGKDLGTLVDEMLADLGTLEFARRGLSVTDEQMQAFRTQTVPEFAPAEICGRAVLNTDRRDGVKFMLEGDAWVMMRPSGTEPLVRIYAEAETIDEVEALLNYAEGVVKGDA